MSEIALFKTNSKNLYNNFNNYLEKNLNSY